MCLRRGNKSHAPAHLAKRNLITPNTTFSSFCSRRTTPFVSLREIEKREGRSILRLEHKTPRARVSGTNEGWKLRRLLSEKNKNERHRDKKCFGQNNELLETT